jgi:hypothetical protein
MAKKRKNTTCGLSSYPEKNAANAIAQIIPIPSKFCLRFIVLIPLVLNFGTKYSTIFFTEKPKIPLFSKAFLDSRSHSRLLTYGYKYAII